MDTAKASATEMRPFMRTFVRAYSSPGRCCGPPRLSSSAVDREHPIQYQPPIGHPHRRAVGAAVEDDELDWIAGPQRLDRFEELVVNLPADDLILVAVADVDRNRMRIIG